MTEYEKRVLAQLRAWVKGQSNHNTVDDECCPDFSCCIPEMMTKDEAARRAVLAWFVGRFADLERNCTEGVDSGTANTGDSFALDTTDGGSGAIYDGETWGSHDPSDY